MASLDILKAAFRDGFFKGFSELGQVGVNPIPTPSQVRKTKSILYTT